MSENFGEMRRAMVDCQIRTTDVTDLRLLDALLSVPREEFVPAARKALAYIDEDAAVGGGRFVMEPSPFAKLAQLADIKPGDLVLDVGCATGYSSAVFSLLAGAVIALESDEDLAAKATETLLDNGYDSVAVVSGPLEEGLASEGPYDVIFVGGSVDFVPDALLDQLKSGGRLVAFEGRGTTAFAHLHVRDDEGQVSSRRVFNHAVKPLPGFQREEAFVF